MTVFVSYTHDDSSFAQALGRELRYLDTSVGIDLWDNSRIPPGANRKDMIEAKLRGAEAAILLISSRYLGSEDCLYEAKVLLARLLPDRVLPLLVSATDLAAYPPLAQLQMGNLEPLDQLNPPERKVAYTEVGVRLRRLLGQPVPGAGGSFTPPNTVQGRRARAAVLVTRYAEDLDGALQQFADEYMLCYNRGQFGAAKEYLKEFEAAPREAHREVADPLHQEILELLRVGPPIDPVHLEGLAKVRDGATLFSHPAYPRLLLGIRKMEKSHREAIAHFEAMERARDMPTCALFGYALGQCYRKDRRLADARTVLKEALNWALGYPDDCCGCGPRCLTSGLRLAIHRGLGAVYRELKEWEKAERCFEDALSYARDESLSDNLRSDFFYSFGYLLFKASFEFGDRRADYLGRALEKLEEARRLCWHWSAPLARIAIVKHLRDEATVYDFLDAWHRARNEENIESPLTAAVCGFALLMMDLETPKAERGCGLTEVQLYKDLEDHYRERYFPQAALDCHAFDIRTILGQRDLPKDDHLWLCRVYWLLQESTKWRARDLGKQTAHLRKFRKRYGLSGGVT